MPLHDICGTEEMEDGDIHAAKIAGWHVLLAYTDGAYLAVNDRCSHAAQRLSIGRMRQCAIMCPAHGARFDLKTGKAISSDLAAIRSFPTFVKNGRVFIDLPDQPPAMNEVPIN